MIVIPKEQPVIEDLNSYYLRIEKLFEHCQGAIGTGGVYFKAPTAEAAVFFDEDNLLNAYYSDKSSRSAGSVAFKKIIETAETNNYRVSVYQIIPERVYFWAYLNNSETLYGDLSSEFTDLESLIKKLETERLTGYLEVKLQENAHGGVLFFYNGEIIGGSSAAAEGTLDRSREYREVLIAKSRESKGTFHVSKINLASQTPLSKAKTINLEVPAAKPARVSPGKAQPAKSPPAAGQRLADPARTLEMLQNLFGMLDKIIRSNKKIKADFETLLKQKCMEKADKYEFLDPFAGEFVYSNGKIIFTGKASQQQLVTSTVECVKEIVAGLGITSSFSRYLDSWRRGFAREIIDFDIEI